MDLTVKAAAARPDTIRNVPPRRPPPGFAGTESVLLATAILGATAMPHVIYVHSALTPKRYARSECSAVRAGPNRRCRVLRTQRLDVLIAMGAAGVVNGAMLTIAAQLFFGSDIPADGLDEVHAGLAIATGGAASRIAGLIICLNVYLLFTLLLG